MIQDIYPDRLDNRYRDIRPEPGDGVLCFEDGRVAAEGREGRLVFPLRREFPEETKCVYLFSVTGRKYFLALNGKAPAACPRYTMQELRGLPLRGNGDIFAAYTGFHLWKWYSTSRYCGACGQRTAFDREERAMVCPACGNRIYPRLNPAVIVGVMNGERLLITRYRTGFAHNALVAGFTEIGETVEETVRREVMEEVGLKVKDIRYFGSQPWGIACDILMGFYCRVDGEDTIRRDDQELKYAEWVRREDIVLQPSDYSLTNEMMKRFRDGREEESMTAWPGPAGARWS